MMMKRNNGYIEEYLNNISTESTRNVYSGALYEFINWYNNNYNSFNKTRNKIETKHINLYMAFLNKNENSIYTKKRKYYTLKMFFEYLRKNNYIDKNPCLDIEFKREKLPRRVPKSFTQHQCNLLLDNINTTNQVRDKMIVEMFMHTGLRLSELISLNVDCFQGDNTIVIGKGEHERYVYINDYIRNKLSDYVKTLNISSHRDTPLFSSSKVKGKRLHCNTIQKMITDAEKKAGLKTGVHLLRHTFATLILQNTNADIYDIQELLGHKDISTTSIYTTIAKDKLKKIVNNNPMIKI
jgi:site-specific recombinase XerD